MNYKMAIFDLDGTVLDTYEGIKEAVKHTIDHFELDNLSETDIRSFVGPPLEQSFRRFYNISEDTAKMYTAEFRKYYADRSILIASVYDGIPQLFSGLIEKNIAIAIATSKCQTFADRLVEYFNLDEWIHICCGSDPGKRMDKNEIIRHCVCESNIKDKENVVMIGDTQYDAKGALKAGVKFIGVTYGFGFKTREDVNKFQNIGYINNPVELLDLV